MGPILTQSEGVPEEVGVLVTPGDEVWAAVVGVDSTPRLRFLTLRNSRIQTGSGSQSDTVKISGPVAGRPVIPLAKPRDIPSIRRPFNSITGTEDTVTSAVRETRPSRPPNLFFSRDPAKKTYPLTEYDINPVSLSHHFLGSGTQIKQLLNSTNPFRR